MQTEQYDPDTSGREEEDALKMDNLKIQRGKCGAVIIRTRMNI